MEKYKYTGPTVLVGEHGGFKGVELSKGMKVDAEVNVNMATIKTLYACGIPLRLDTKDLVVAAKYLEPMEEESFEEPYGLGEMFAKDVSDMLKGFGVNGTYGRIDMTVDNDDDDGDEEEDGHEVGGEHYKMAIEPWDYIQANHLDFDSGNIVKYASRHKQKNGAEDIKKIISYAKHILKTQYGEEE